MCMCTSTPASHACVPWRWVPHIFETGPLRRGGVHRRRRFLLSHLWLFYHFTPATFLHLFLSLLLWGLSLVHLSLGLGLLRSARWREGWGRMGGACNWGCQQGRSLCGNSCQRPCCARHTYSTVRKYIQNMYRISANTSVFCIFTYMHVPYITYVRIVSKCIQAWELRMRVD